jgi:hypothetical protein
MAIIYVNSGAGGTNAGTSWTNAYTSLASTTGAAAGDEIYVHKTHSQDPGATVTYNWSNGTEANPVRILCVDKDASDALSTGATIAQTVAGRQITLNGSIYVDGMTFNSADTFTIGTSSKSARYSNCTLGIVVTTNSRSLTVAGTGASVELHNCTINVNNATGSTLSNTGSGNVLVTRSTINFHASATSGPTGASTGFMEFRGCEIGGATTQFVIATAGTQVKASRCKLGSYTNLFSTSPAISAWGMVDECSSSATVTGPTIGLVGYATDRGTVTGDSGRYRTGGATRDSVNFSWAITPSASAEERIFPIRTPDFSKKVSGGSSVTITAYVAGGAELYDDEVWIELEGPSDSNSVKGYFHSSRVAYGTTRSALTSDSSTWNGSGVGTVRKITHTYTPDHSGLLVARVCYAKTSGAAIYVDPQLGVA